VDCKSYRLGMLRFELQGGGASGQQGARSPAPMAALFRLAVSLLTHAGVASPMANGGTIPPG